MISYLRLIRLPNAVTAMADILAGALIVRKSFSGLTETHLLLLLAASSCLYGAGMAFNDIADRKEDARVRPGRPLPSGAVSLRGAVTCGVLLGVLGLGAAACAGGPSALYALALAIAIVLYDFSAKHVLLAGPLVLGGCRFLNVQLGMSAAPNFFPNVWEAAQWNVFQAPALAVGLYAAGLTAFSAQEEGGRRRRALILGWLFVGGAMALAGGTAPRPWAWPLLGLLALLLGYQTWRLRRESTPEAARDLVKHGVLGVCVLDAALVLGHGGTSHWKWVLLLVGLIVPGVLLAKWLNQKEA